MKKFCLNTPINGVSFGQLSFAILKEILDRGIEPNFFPIGQIDLKSQSVDEKLNQKITEILSKTQESHSRKDPCFKLWHLNGALESPSEKQALLSFYELDSPTKQELNAVRNNKTLFSSKYAVELFKSHGADCDYLPLFFDSLNFKKTDREYFSDGRIVFNLCGKFEKRKHHAKILRSWVKKYGNNNKYHLQCAIFNPFLSAEENDAVIHEALEGKRFPNVQALKPMGKNSLYNDFLNSGDILLGMSGGEGWGLPEFHSMALGKHAVILNAHSYKEFATEDNAVLVEPSGKIDSEDGRFFKQGAPFNQGQIYDWDPDDFIDGCELAIKRYQDNPENQNGLKLQEDFTVSKTVDHIIKHMEDL